MKKIFASFVATAALLSMAACGKTTSFQDVFASTDELYVFSALSATTLLSGVTSTSLSTNEDSESNPSSSLSLDEVERYLEIAENFLGSNNGFEIENSASDHPDYANKLIMASFDLLGNEVSHTLYFNEEPEESDEDESTFALTGMLVSNESSYPISGLRKNEDDEQEIEITSYIDELNYVKVSTKIEENERNFEYEIASNGLTQFTEMKVEMEDNETKLEVKFESDTTQFEFELKREQEDNQDILKIEYKLENDATSEEGTLKVLVSLDPLTNEKIYSYYLENEEGDFEEFDDEEASEEENSL